MNPTPKEILLEPHRAVEADLDRVRESVLAAELGKGKQGNAPPKTPLLVKLWLELIWPSRRAWAALAAVWTALAVIHFASTPRPAAAPSALEVAAAWQEEQRLLNQLVSQRPPMPVAPPPPAIVPDKSAGFFSRDEFAWA